MRISNLDSREGRKDRESREDRGLPSIKNKEVVTTKILINRLFIGVYKGAINRLIEGKQRNKNSRNKLR